MVAPTVVIAIGNPSRGDDALGPILAQRLEAWLEEEGRNDVEVIEDFQLQIEHALDLKGREQVIFVDAGTGSTPAPFSLEPAVAVADFGHSTHAISPGAVLHVYHQTLGELPPPAWVLCIRGESFELGEDLSGAARKRLEEALTALQERLGCVANAQ